MSVILDLFGELDWLRVVLAAVAYFILGSLWYANFLFGKQYRAAIGAEEGPPPVAAMVANAVAWFIAAMVLGLIVVGLGTDTVVDGIVLGLVVSIGFIGTNRVVGRMYGADNPKLMPINAPYTLLGYALMGAILAA